MVFNSKHSKNKNCPLQERKTKVTEFQFHLGNSVIEICTTYKYLGIIMDEYLNFEENARTLSSSGSRALGSIISTYKRMKFMGYNTYYTLFTACILPILNYCSAVWGLKKFDVLEQVQCRAIRAYLGVNIHQFWLYMGILVGYLL